MIRMLFAVLFIAIIGGVIWWERTEKARLRQIFFSIYNKALAKAKNDNLFGVPVNILDVMDETDIGPTALHTILKKMEDQRYVTLSSNTVKLTPEGVAYFRLKYLSEGV